jgi:uncharacterized hydrophobic protein (TIGR00271 family)
MKSTINKVLDFIDLHKGEEDKKKVLENIIGNISFKGSNLWILACAILIASVGLNVNSTAVIIGAMLISPLMGPIVGAGFGLGMYDFELLKKSIKNLSIATIVSLLVSTLYFYISPFKEAQSELLARTSPNIYDILIAFFGGLVGIIAVTRVEKGNPIPGVAIATALMPPLCTAGYSLAIGNFAFFIGAIYLYSINCVFICIATFVIVKYLNYPIAQQIDLKRQKMIRHLITTLIVLMIVPSVYFAYKLFDEKKYNQKVETFIQNEFTYKDYVLIYKKININSNPKKIELAFFSNNFSSNDIKNLNLKLKKYNIQNTVLRIKQDTISLRRDILNEIKNNKSKMDQKDLLINDMRNQLSKFQTDYTPIINESKILFPEISNLKITNYSYKEEPNKMKLIPVILYRSDKKLTPELHEKLKSWLKQRLEKDSVEIYRQEYK